MVNVRLMEKRVKSHVGRVMVLKVMIQYRVPGSTRKTVRMARARKPNVEGVCSAAWRAATAEGTTLVAFRELLVAALAEELTEELTASVAMMLEVGSQRSLFKVTTA
jgi:hypothetical protein